MLRGSIDPQFSFILVIFLTFSLFLIIVLYISLRRKTYDLEARNRKLSILRKLDQTMMSYYTDFEEVAQKITDIFASELGFENTLLAVIDEQKGVLKTTAMSNLTSVLKPKGFEIPLSDNENVIIQAIRSGQTKLTHDYQKVLVPTLNGKQGVRLDRSQHSTTTIIYPIKARNKIIGAMLTTVDKNLNVLKSSDMQNIADLLEVVGISLENALLYADLKKAGWQLAETNKKMQDLDRMKDEFVSLTSHELKTPMTAIRSYAWMALHKSDVPLSDKLKKYLVRVLISTERLINLVNDMLNISRIESGRIEINPEPIDLISLAKDIIDEVYSSRSEEKNIDFVLIEQEIPKVFADGEKLRQVFLNIAGNALKFSPMEGKIVIGFFTDGKIVETFVKDQGPGISQEDIGRLFKKFGRLDTSYEAAAASGGSGLGLYISKSLIELMHGKIWAESGGLGRGATFKFSLPVATNDVLAHPDLFRVKPSGQVKGLEPVAL